jgi:hypothetical protein
MAASSLCPLETIIRLIPAQLSVQGLNSTINEINTTNFTTPQRLRDQSDKPTDMTSG